MFGSRHLCIFLISVLFLIFISQPSHSQASELEKTKLLIQQVDTLYKQRRYAEAIPIVEKALAMQEKALGLEHPDVAASLLWLGSLYYSLEDYNKAEPLFKKALAIYEKTLGTEHPLLKCLWMGRGWEVLLMLK